MTTLVPIPISVSTSTFHSNDPFRKRVCSLGPNPLRPSWLCFSQRSSFSQLQRNRLRLWSARQGIVRVKGGFLMGANLRGSNRRVVLVRSNRGLFDGGGGVRDDGSNARALGNLVLAIGFAYLTLTGQLGWVFDALVSIWLIAFVIPIIGVGAFLWWAGQDMIQSTCPNCDNDFQIFRSMINDELQLCPYCSQPFSVVDDEFVREPVYFSNETTSSAQPFNGFSKKFAKGKKTTQVVVDVEAEIMDVD